MKLPNKPHEADAGCVCQRMLVLMLLLIGFFRAAYGGALGLICFTTFLTLLFLIRA
jgi:uncharacterized membrane protein YkgB